jgi:hypothetical protein
MDCIVPPSSLKFGFPVDVWVLILHGSNGSCKWVPFSSILTCSCCKVSVFVCLESSVGAGTAVVVWPLFPNPIANI